MEGEKGIPKKESPEAAFERQKLDCNCNDCAFLERDFERFKKAKQRVRDWEAFSAKLQRKKLLRQAVEEKKKGNYRSHDKLLKKRSKIQPTPSYSNLTQFGHCTKFDESVEFIPNVCQIETQECFVHRKDHNCNTKKKDHAS